MGEKERRYVTNWPIYILYYEFSNDFDAQSEFNKTICQKKAALNIQIYLIPSKVGQQWVKFK